MPFVATQRSKMTQLVAPEHAGIGFVKNNCLSFGNYWCIVYNDLETYGTMADKREDNGCTGMYFLSFYTKEDHEKKC